MKLPLKTVLKSVLGMCITVLLKTFTDLDKWTLNSDGECMSCVALLTVIALGLTSLKDVK